MSDTEKAPLKETFRIQVIRIVEGRMPSEKWEVAGKNDDGSDRYAHVTRERFERRENTIFQAEADQVPDLVKLAKMVASK